jgi:hypothetical protein
MEAVFFYFDSEHRLEQTTLDLRTPATIGNPAT